jgi:hypothetical protein
VSSTETDCVGRPGLTSLSSIPRASSYGARIANARRLRKEAEINAVNNGVEVVPENNKNGHRSLASAVTEYLEETKLTRKPKTHAAYSKALAYFQESCHKLFLHETERRDLLKFSAFLRDEKKQSPRLL